MQVGLKALASRILVHDNAHEAPGNGSASLAANPLTCLLSGLAGREGGIFDLCLKGNIEEALTALGSNAGKEQDGGVVRDLVPILE